MNQQPRGSLWKGLQEGVAPNQGPPQHISPGELWTKLQAMPRPNREVDFPRKNEVGDPVGKVALWVLTQEEQMICAAAAEAFAKKQVPNGQRDDIGYATVYANASVVEILYRSCREPSDLTRPIFPSPTLIRQNLTTEECARLFESYLQTQLELGPIVAHLSPAELDAWIDRIGQGGLAASPFPLLSSEMQTLLAFTMAVLIRDLRKVMSSVGSPPVEAPPNETSDAPIATDEAVQPPTE